MSIIESFLKVNKTTLRSGLKYFTKPSAPDCIDGLKFIPLETDTINLSKKISRFQFKPNEYKCKLENFEDTMEYYRSENFTKPYDNLYLKTLRENELKHKGRLSLLPQKEIPSYNSVSQETKDAIDMIQYEKGAYYSLQKNLRNGQALTDEERNFLEFCNSQMAPASENITVFRSISPYNGFKEQIQNGCIDFKGFSSTSRNYGDFFKRWNHGEIINNGNELIARESYILKINIKKGSNILDCNATYTSPMGEISYPRMREEIVLPEGIGIVKRIDNELNIIEIEFSPKIIS